MNKNKKRIVVICGIVFIILFLIGCFTINSVVEVNTFKSEINRLEKLDITRDRYNTKIKSSKDYGIIEKNIKFYLDNCAYRYQDMNSILNDKSLNVILSADNYKKDGPKFNKSIKYINELKNRADKDLKQLEKCPERKEIMDVVLNAEVDNYYISLYEDIMFDSNISNMLDKSLKDGRTLNNKVNTLLDNTLGVIVFLKDHKDKWSIKKDKIYFDDYKLYEQYNDIAKNIKK